MAPVYLDEEVLASVRIVEIEEKRSKKVLHLETTLEKVEEGKLAIKGEAKLLI